MNQTYAQQINREIKGLENVDFAAHHQVFFKAIPGGYGEGDYFLGLKVPVIRAVVKGYENVAGLCDISELLDSEWHEVRFAGLVLLVNLAMKKEKIFYGGNTATSSLVNDILWKDAWDKGRTSEFLKWLPCAPADASYADCICLYLAKRSAINNWDLVDLSTPSILGPVVFHDEGLLDTLADSGFLWTERMAILATFYGIRRGYFRQTIKMADFFLGHKHDLIHKACGWLLREVGKRDRRVLIGFLDANANKMPRTMLRYSIEHFSAEERSRYLARAFKL